MPNKNDEIILVVPNEKLFNGVGLFEGVISSEEDDTKTILQNVSDHYTTMRRGDAEEDNTHKQPIPYAVLTVGDKAFHYERLSNSGESRLHHKTSIGLGGHMNEVKEAKSFKETLLVNLIREISEETLIKDAEGNAVSEADLEKHLDVQEVGLLNNEEGVGVYHLCILYKVVLPEGYTVEVNPNEADQLKGELVAISELREKHSEQLEDWSALTLEVL